MKFYAAHPGQGGAGPGRAGSLSEPGHRQRTELAETNLVRCSCMQQPAEARNVANLTASEPEPDSSSSDRLQHNR